MKRASLGPAHSRRYAAAICVAVAAVAACSARHDPSAIFGDAGPDGTVDGGTIDADFMQPGDASIFEAGCAKGTATARKDPIYLLIVLDGSGSMGQDAKWQAVVPALDLFVEDLLMHKDPTFGVGLTIFSDTNDRTGGAGPYPNMDVPIAFVDATQAAKLHGRIDAARPKGDTPTLAVLQGQYAALASYAPSAPLVGGGKKALVFMTDGVPYPDPGTQQAASIRAVSGAYAMSAPSGPITTLAVGIGYFFPYDPLTYDQKFMGEVAVAGGAPNPMCDPNDTVNSSRFCHFQVTPNGQNDAYALEQEFLIAFDKIRARLASCELSLEKPDGGAPVEPDKVNVVFTDDHGYENVVPEDPTDGWTYDDPNNPTKVILHGKSCSDLKANVRGKVDVVLGCKTVVR